MSETKRILELEKENKKLKEDNEYLYQSLIQMHRTIDRLLNRFMKKAEDMSQLRVSHG